MNDTSFGQYIRANDKFAALALSVKIDNSVATSDLGEVCLIAEADFPVDDLWKQWLGSIATEDLASCDVFFVARQASVNPAVFDSGSQLLRTRMHNIYVGLVLTGPWAPAYGPLVLVGGREGEVIGLRRHEPLEAAVPGIFESYPALTMDQITVAVELGKRIGEIPASNIKGGHWRLWRTLDIFRKAVAIEDLVERVHQYCRCIDGLILPEVGRTKQQFKSRTELFIGPGHHDLMDGLYDIRSADEHLNETKYLEVFNRDVRVDVLRKEMIVANIVRNAVARVIRTPHLWPHFGNAAALEAFWKIEAADRRKLWGDAIDPLTPVAKFDPAHITDAQLGGP